MRITIFDLEDWEREGFESLTDEHEVKLLGEPLSARNAKDHRDAEVVSGFVYSKFTDAVMQQLESLKLIVTRSTGFDHIPLDHCREQNITVCNVPTYGSNTVAEHVFGLLLTISHKLEQAIDRTRKGDFSPKGLQGFDLLDKTMGIVGTGDIGRETIRIAKGFGMDVLGFDMGNVRELRNCVESMVVLANSNRLTVEDVPPMVRKTARTRRLRFEVPENTTLAEIEEAVITQTLERCGANRTQAAGKLNISVRTLQRKLNRWNVAVA